MVSIETNINFWRIGFTLNVIYLKEGPLVNLFSRTFIVVVILFCSCRRIANFGSLYFEYTEHNKRRINIYISYKHSRIDRCFTRIRQRCGKSIMEKRIFPFIYPRKGLHERTRTRVCVWKKKRQRETICVCLCEKQSFYKWNLRTTHTSILCMVKKTKKYT